MSRDMTPEEYAKRNKEIYMSRQNGETFGAIARRYGVTRTCIAKICQRCEEAERRRREADLARKEAEEFLRGHRDYLVEDLFPLNTAQGSRVQHCLRRAGFERLSDLIPYLYGEAQYDGYRRLMIIRNFGKKSLDLVLAKVEEVMDGD